MCVYNNIDDVIWTLILIFINDYIPYFRFIMPPVIDLDDHRFYRLVTLSNKLAAPVLRRLIKQYCTSVPGLTFEEVLNLYKHELFHYWHGATAGCCKCSGRRFTRVLLDKQWHTLFTDISASLPATHAHSGHDAKGCSEVVSARPGIDVDVCDISLASSILTNITGKITTTHVVGLIAKTSVTTSVNISGLLEYTVDQLSSRLGVNGFELYLSRHQHKLFHQMEKQRCCQCTSDPEGKNVIKPFEWMTMFNSTPTPCASAVCSHQYSPIPGITRTSLTTQLLHRIGQAVGPVITVRSVRNQIAHATGTMDDPTFNALWGEMYRALDELIDIIADPAWRADMRSQIATLKTCPINGEMWEEYRRDLSKYLEVIMSTLYHEVHFEHQAWWEVMTSYF